VADFVLQTDAALVGRLGSLLADAFPDAEFRVEGPVSESVGPEEIVNLLYAGSMAFFTVTGGLPPTIDAIKAIIAYIKDASCYPKVGRTVLRYVDKDERERHQVEIDLATSDETVAIEAVRRIFGRLRNGDPPRGKT